MINGDVVGEVRNLTERDGANILQYGFGPVTQLLLENGLLDEFRIWLHPVLSGKAKPADLLYRDLAQIKFTHTGTDVRSSGIVILTYSPKLTDRATSQVN